MNLHGGTSPSGLTAVYLAAYGVRDESGDWRLPAAAPAPADTVVSALSAAPPASAIAATATTVPPPVQTASTHAATPAPEKAFTASPAGWLAEWDASAALQAEFSRAGDYVAFKRAEADGRVRIATGGLALARPAASATAAATAPAGTKYTPGLLAPVKRNRYGGRVAATFVHSQAEREASDHAAVVAAVTAKTSSEERRITWQQRWVSSGDIQSEFIACDDYAAHMEAMATGRFKLR